MKYSLPIPFLLLSLTNPGALAQVIEAPFKITITAPKTDLKIGDAIPIHIVLQSTSEKQIALPEVRHDGTQGEYNYRVTVEDHNGSRPQDMDHGKRLKEGGEVMTSRSTIIKYLNYGDVVEEDVDLKNLVRIDSPGNYTVQVERTDPLYSSLHVKSSKITIHINP